MRMRMILAAMAAPALAVLGLAVQAAPAAQADVAPPGGCVIVTNNGGSGFGLHDNGHNVQMTTTRNGTCYSFVNPKVLGGHTWYQLEDEDAGLCLDEGAPPSGKVSAESCPSSPPTAEQVRIAGTSNNQIEFDNGSTFLTAASLTSGAALEESSSGTPTSENQWAITSRSPTEQVLPVDFIAPTSADWTTIEKTEPFGGIRNAIFEVCETVGMTQECGGDTTSADTAWDAPLSALCSAGITPLYYIDTAFGADSLASVEAAVSNAVGWYPVATTGCQMGFMFDEVPDTDPSDGGSGTYYNDLVSYTSGLTGGSTIFLNAGTATTTNYPSYASNVIEQVFEGSDATWQTGYTAPAWLTATEQSQVAATVQDATASTYGGDITDAQNRFIGNVYIGDETASPPPYDTLPSFLSGEVRTAALDGTP